MSKITKAVIPCGGMGTRFLPITKAVPKEILPIIDTPVLAYIVNEAIDSGISDIMIVLGNGKDAIKSYFSPNPELEDSLAKAGKDEFLQIVRKIHGSANIQFAVQKVPRGSADAVLQAEKFTGKEAFCLAWGDDLIDSENPVMGQLMAAYECVNASILGVQKWETDDIVKYGVVDILASDGSTHKLKGIVEKPPLDKLPSRLASLGRYVLTGNVYDRIRKTPLDKKGELSLTETLNDMCSIDNGVYAYEFIGKRYDMGDKLGALKANVEFGLRNKSFGMEFKEYIKKLAESI